MPPVKCYVRGRLDGSGICTNDATTFIEFPAVPRLHLSAIRQPVCTECALDFNGALSQVMNEAADMLDLPKVTQAFIPSSN